jgi:uncharacterized protein YoxC
MSDLKMSGSFCRVEDYFADPVSSETMEKVLVDQHGHSFDKSTLTILMHKAHKEEKPLMCPFGQPMDRTRIVPNLSVNSLLEDMRKNKTSLISTEDLSSTL